MQTRVGDAYRCISSRIRLSSGAANNERDQYAICECIDNPYFDECGLSCAPVADCTLEDEIGERG